MRSNSNSSVGRLLRFGPGLVLAVIAGYYVWRMNLPTPQPGGAAPRIERNHIEPGRTNLSAPEPRWIMEHAKDLGLTEKQTVQLRKLKDRWDTNMKPLEAQLNEASTAVSNTLPEASSKGAAIETVRAKAAPVSELTHELLEARKAWWQEASAVLTPAQKLRTEELWSQRFANSSHAAGWR
jgi:Spy/CpxP family protein refolding chaperone